MPRRRDEAAVALGPEPETVVRQVVLRFLAWSLVALVLVGVATVFVSEHIARDDALRDARLRGASMAHRVTAPLVDSSVRAGDPEAVARLATIVRNRMLDGSVNHVKIWGSDGRVIWSDDPGITGSIYPLPPDAEPLFGTRRAVTDHSDLIRPEDLGEREEGPLLEVFVGAFDADGVPVVVESHMSPDTMEEDQAAIFRGLLPLAVGSLLLFQLSIMPLWVSLARRVERSQRERSGILRRALMVSDLERRRIAQDLHDGVIQDLAGLSYVIPAVLAKRGSQDEATHEQTVERITSILQHDIAALRSLMTDIYPPDLEAGSLGPALRELAARAADAELEVDLDVPPRLRLEPDTARLAYRVVREGLRNVLRHAEASRAEVRVQRRDGQLQVRVSDDGRGVDEAGAKPSGHFGLTLLADTVRDVGGTLEIRPRAERGTVLEVTFPELVGID